MNNEYKKKMAELQGNIKHVDLSVRGTPEDRVKHILEMMKSLKPARRRANRKRLLK